MPPSGPEYVDWMALRRVHMIMDPYDQNLAEWRLRCRTTAGFLIL